MENSQKVSFRALRKNLASHLFRFLKRKLNILLSSSYSLRKSKINLCILEILAKFASVFAKVNSNFIPSSSNYAAVQIRLVCCSESKVKEEKKRRRNGWEAFCTSSFFSEGLPTETH